MNSLQAYAFDVSAVRALAVDGEPWFVATDLAGILGYRDAANMVRILDDDEKGTHLVSTLGGDQSLSIVSESGLYHAIFKSRRPEAQRFRKWVTSEVLPEIRKTGRFEASPVGIKLGLAMVREARALFGPDTARGVWSSMGFPAASDGEEAAGDVQADPLLADLREWLAERDSATMAELLAALDIPEAGSGMRMRRRIGRLMRHLAWDAEMGRADGAVVKVFRPLAQEA